MYPHCTLSMPNHCFSLIYVQSLLLLSSSYYRKSPPSLYFNQSQIEFPLILVEESFKIPSFQQKTDKMKNRASGLVKQIITGLSSMAKAKTVSLRTKASAIKARLIIFSLLRNKKFLMSSLSEKLHSVLGQNSNANEECFLEDGTDQSKAMVGYTDNAHAYDALPNPSDTQVVEDRDRDGYESYYRYEEEEDKYPDLTHTLFESEDLNFGGSVIDMVKNSKEEAGEEFRMEDEIDHMADLFIRRFRRQIILQKQESLKRNLEMLQNGA